MRSTKLSSNKTVFTEDQKAELQNGYNCGFIALKTERNTVINFAIENIHNEEIRKLLLPEIRTLCAIECTTAIEEDLLKSNAKSNKLNELLDIASAFVDIDVPVFITDGINNLLNKSNKRELILVRGKEREQILKLYRAYEEAHASVQNLLNRCNDLLGNFEENRKNFDQLLKFFTLNSNANISAKSIFKVASAKVENAREALDFILLTPEICTKYLINYYSINKGWLAFQPVKSGGYNSSLIDIIAMMKKCQIVVWQNVKDRNHKLKPIYITGNYTGLSQEVIQEHIRYSSSIQGHFTALIMQSGKTKQVIDYGSTAEFNGTKYIGYDLGYDSDVSPEAREGASWWGYSYNSNDSAGPWGEKDISERGIGYCSRSSYSNISSNYDSEDLEQDMCNLEISTEEGTSESEEMVRVNNPKIVTRKDKFFKQLLFSEIQRQILQQFDNDTVETGGAVVVKASMLRKEDLVQYCNEKLGVHSLNINQVYDSWIIYLNERAINILKNIQERPQLRWSI